MGPNTNYILWSLMPKWLSIIGVVSIRWMFTCLIVSLCLVLWYEKKIQKATHSINDFCGKLASSELCECNCRQMWLEASIEWYFSEHDLACFPLSMSMWCSTTTQRIVIAHCASSYYEHADERGQLLSCICRPCFDCVCCWAQRRAFLHILVRFWSTKQQNQVKGRVNINI